MARRSEKAPRPRPRVEPTPPPVATVVEPLRPIVIPRRTLSLIVVGLLLLHYGLALASLRQENPTVDEVNHLPAGVSYWETGTFKLYRHNPPLVKLFAAIPVVLSGAEMRPLYAASSWRQDSPPPAAFGQGFMLLNSGRYFELFTLSRSIMPLFSVAGGIVVFLWSRKLWGDLGGLLSLAMWSLCPNVLAHTRLITSDAAAATIGMAATFTFWRYLQTRTWKRAALAGVMLGVAQLTKFSMLLLFAIWPLIWLAHEATRFERAGFVRRFLRALGQGVFIVAVCVLVIDVGYLFEGVGRPLGSFDFASRSFLTRPGVTPKRSPNELIDIHWKHRVNRVRGTVFAALPSPLPSQYLLGFDEQKIEADGFPIGWMKPDAPNPDDITGYPVYLDGVLRRNGWRDYYIRAFLYKTPEATLGLLTLAIVAFALGSRASWSDESAVLIPIVAFLGAMTFLTDINLGLRYVLPIFPYLFIFCGRLTLADTFGLRWRKVGGVILGSLLTILLISTSLIHPHYLASFNAVSGGPDRDPPRLIDSNLDWGQDLVGLRRWLKEHGETEPAGLAIFGQISPNLFEMRKDGFAWFLPPMKPRTWFPMTSDTSALKGPAPRLKPGLYAVSASLVAGLPWRVYDPSTEVWGGTWRAEEDAFGYFRTLKPFERIGHSILLYRLTQDDADRLNRELGLP